MKGELQFRIPTGLSGWSDVSNYVRSQTVLTVGSLSLREKGLFLVGSPGEGFVSNLSKKTHRGQ